MYGKIYGNWNFFGPGGMNIEQFVFNTTANDTNLEDLHTAERSLKNWHQREEHRTRRSASRFGRSDGNVTTNTIASKGLNR